MTRPRKKIRPTKVEKLELTAMIDVIFLLIIFFILVTDFSQQELEDVQLPRAARAFEDKSEEERMIVNIRPLGNDTKLPGDYAIGEYWVKGVKHSKGSLIPLMREYAGKDREPGGPVGGIPKASNKSLLIRCDRRVGFEYVQKLMQWCVDPAEQYRVMIWKIQIAIAKQGDSK